MNETLIFWLCILVGSVGISVAAGIIWFGRSLFLRQVDYLFPDHPMWHEFFDMSLKDRYSREDIPRHLAEGYSEYLRRRNEFWVATGQVVLAVLLVTILSILLLADVISPEAGLPILSGVSGFVIAKGVSGSKAANIPQHRREG